MGKGDFYEAFGKDDGVDEEDDDVKKEEKDMDEKEIWSTWQARDVWDVQKNGKWGIEKISSMGRSLKGGGRGGEWE